MDEGDGLEVLWSRRAAVGSDPVPWHQAALLHTQAALLHTQAALLH